MTLSGKVHSLTLSPTHFCTYRSLSLLLSLVILVHSTEIVQLGTSAFSGTLLGGGGGGGNALPTLSRVQLGAK